MSDLKQYIEETIYKILIENLKKGNFSANLKIEIDMPIEIKGVKGRIVGEITIGDTLKEVKINKTEEVNLNEIENILKSLGV
ncbi:MAG: hypothetical protein LM593_03575 [Candidatus Verstraetearchaeota archaeon]|jgi:hypothetical protein|nr:hypothetical protein [Candidatus Verstraetearchaeota archaeon]